MGLLPQRNVYPLFFLFLYFAAPIREASPSAILWTAPAILIAAMMIAWAAESAQFFIAQGFALAILAWMQTAAGVRRRSGARLASRGSLVNGELDRRAAPAHRFRLAGDLLHRRLFSPAQAFWAT